MHRIGDFLQHRGCRTSLKLWFHDVSSILGNSNESTNIMKVGVFLEYVSIVVVQFWYLPSFRQGIIICWIPEMDVEKYASMLTRSLYVCIILFAVLIPGFFFHASAMSDSASCRLHPVSVRWWGRPCLRDAHQSIHVHPFIQPWQRNSLSRCSRAAAATNSWSNQPRSCAVTASVESASPGGTSSRARGSARSVDRCTRACPKSTLCSGKLCAGLDTNF